MIWAKTSRVYCLYCNILRVEEKERKNNNYTLLKSNVKLTIAESATWRWFSSHRSSCSLPVTCPGIDHISALPVTCPQCPGIDHISALPVTCPGIDHHTSASPVTCPAIDHISELTVTCPGIDHISVLTVTCPGIDHISALTVTCPVIDHHSLSALPFT